MRGCFESPGRGERGLAAKLAGSFQNLLVCGIRDRALYSEILRLAIEANRGVLAVWTVWEPDALDGRDAAFRHAPGHDETGRFLACWHRACGQVMLEATTGYDEPRRPAWYWIPKRRGAPCRVQSLLYPLGGKLCWLASEVAPIFDAGRFVGVVGTDWSSAPALPSTGRRVVTVSGDHESALTAREREVLHWLRLGKTNEEIGLILGISRHTVKNHLERIYQKLGVHSRYEALGIPSLASA